MPGRKRQALAVLGAAIVITALAVPGARAQSVDGTSATITSGGLVLGAIAIDDFGGLFVTGTDQETTAPMADYTVADLRGGLGGGWSLTAQATQFDSGTSTLPLDSMTMAPPLITPEVGNLAVPPVPTLTGVTLDSASPAVIAEADPGTLVPSGTGTWTFSNPTDLTLAVPADVEVGTYTSTVTMTLSAAP